MAARDVEQDGPARKSFSSIALRTITVSPCQRTKIFDLQRFGACGTRDAGGVQHWYWVAA